MTDLRDNGSSEKRIYVTLSGLPLSFELKWPFHKSTSGADFHVLHADIRLGNSEGLHAPMAVNLSATLFEIMPSLDPKDVEAPVINALRKEVDKRQVEFVKSGKRIPVPFSSRHYDFKRSKWMFGTASEEQIDLLIFGKVFWQSKLAGGAAWVGDPAEALYVESTVEQMLARAGKLAAQGLIKLDGELAFATDSLNQQEEKFEAARLSALAELEKKHAFERGGKAS